MSNIFLEWSGTLAAPAGRGGELLGISSWSFFQHHHSNIGVIVRSRLHSSAFLRLWFWPSCGTLSQMPLHQTKTHILRYSSDVTRPANRVDEILKLLLGWVYAPSTREHIGREQHHHEEVCNNTWRLKGISSKSILKGNENSTYQETYYA